MVGFGANRRGGRLPSFVLIALLVAILVLSFNYWTVSSKHGRLLDDLTEAQTQVRRTDAARSRLEKRNSELMAQVDAHRKQVDQRDGDFTALESKLQVREALIKRCTDDKMKLQNDVTAQTSESQRLNEQLKDLRQEFLKQEDQLREVRRNSTYLERKLEYESLQCGRQIAQLKEDYEEKKKALEVEAAKLKKSLLVENRGGGAVRARADMGVEGENTKERDPVAKQQRDSPELKAGMGKPGSDAGMPGIEDSEVGKVEGLQFALKKPAITLSRGGEAGAKEDRGGAGAGAGDPALDHPDLQRDGAPLPGVPLVGVPLPAVALAGGALAPERAGLMHMQQPPPPPAVGDRPVLFDEDSKALVHADELGENQRQFRAPNGGKDDGLEMKAVVLPPPNPVQVLPNPVQLPHHRQSRFFDENESPVDPQHGSKLADYNGDDGNVGEYEADKQAELAYNEEEDGDGGEEDVQDDEDHELQGDRPVDYRKQHKAIDLL